MTGLGDNGRERGDDPLHDEEPFIDNEPLAGEDQWDEDDDAAAEELSLRADDEPLPWLESDGYEDEEESSGLGRLLLTFLIGLVAIGGVLYALWYWSNRPDPELVADGSTIEAPEGPMKERPDDPGGKTFEGTGDVAPGVGEGQTREGRLATDAGSGDTAPRPSIDAAGSPTPAATPTAAAALSGTGVQVGAYSSRASAEAGWAALGRQTSALSGVRYRIVEGEIESGKVFRLQAVPGDAAAASALCGKLKAQGIPCQVKN